MKKQTGDFDVADSLAHVQEQMNCKTCYYADQKAIEKRQPCCTRWGGPRVDDQGKCLVHRGLEESREDYRKRIEEV